MNLQKKIKKDLDYLKLHGELPERTIMRMRKDENLSVHEIAVSLKIQIKRVRRIIMINLEPIDVQQKLREILYKTEHMNKFVKNGMQVKQTNLRTGETNIYFSIRHAERITGIPMMKIKRAILKQIKKEPFPLNCRWEYIQPENDLDERKSF